MPQGRRIIPAQLPDMSGFAKTLPTHSGKMRRHGGLRDASQTHALSSSGGRPVGA